MENKTITETLDDNVNQNIQEENVAESEIRYPLFIIFAEYLGYESPLIKWAEDWCNGNTIPEYQRRILKVDALSIYDKILEEYTKKDLRDWYLQFYNVILETYENNLIKLDSKSDLPFP